MAKFLFTSGSTRGTFIAVEPDGERRECTGVEIVLGVQSGETAQEALSKLLSKLNQSHTLPEYLFNNKNVIAYKTDEGEWVNHKGLLYQATKEDEILEPFKGEGYQDLACKWCGKVIPNNGGSQFAHLQKHTRQLLKAKLITDEQYHSIRSTTLTKEFEEIFIKAKESGVLKK